MWPLTSLDSCAYRVDPGFLERGSICIKVWGFAFADFYLIFLKYPMKMK